MNGLILNNEDCSAFVSFLPLVSQYDSPIHNVCLDLVHTQYKTGFKCHCKYWLGILILLGFRAGSVAFQIYSLKQKMNKL